MKSVSSVMIRLIQCLGIGSLTGAIPAALQNAFSTLRGGPPQPAHASTDIWSSDVEPLPPPMGPTVCKPHRAADPLGIGEFVVGGIGIGLQHAGVAPQQRDRVLAA